MQELNFNERQLWKSDLETLKLLPTQNGLSKKTAHTLQKLEVLDHAGWFRRLCLRQKTVTKIVPIDKAALASISNEILGKTATKDPEQKILDILTTLEALPPNFLEADHPFVDMISDYTSIAINVRTTPKRGQATYKTLYCTEQQLANYLKLNVDVVKHVIKHRGVKELLTRAKMISDTHIANLKNHTDWNMEQSRAIALIIDIIFDSPTANNREFQDYETALGTTLKVKPSGKSIRPHERQIAIGSEVLLGQGTSARVYRKFVSLLGTPSSRRIEGVVAEKRFYSFLKDFQPYEKAMANRLAGTPFVIRHYPHRSHLLYELCTGKNLSSSQELIQSLPVPAKWHLFLQILQGIQGIHQKGYIHGDIKPGNIVITHTRAGLEPRIVDLGSVRKRLGLGNLVGTYIYMPPEELLFPLNHILNGYSDAFSAGIVALRSFMGITPNWTTAWTKSQFPVSTLRNMMLEELAELPSRIDTEGANLPVEIREAVKILIKIEATERNLDKAIELIQKAF